MLSVPLTSSLSDYISSESQALSLFPVPVFLTQHRLIQLKAQHLPESRQIDV